MNKFDFLTPDFVKSCNCCGIQCHIELFPWNCLGLPDDEIMAIDMKFADGRPMPKSRQRGLLGFVRAQEKLLIERWKYVQLRDKKMGPIPKQGAQLELFA
jgi:hypothetical protein